MTSAVTPKKSPATLEGVVVKKSGNKTVAVEVVRHVAHPLYRKSMKVTKRFLAHDPEEKAQIGDRVLLVKIRPISKRKHWKVVKK
jgi:small subunit ribosomal protein S17